jgi:hypothetical protein
MAYEVFTRTAVRVTSPAISIVPDGRIVLNSAASRAMSETGVKTALLLWDKVDLKIAIKATSKGDRNGYSVSISNDKHTGSIRAKGFVNHIGWSAPRRQLFLATWNREERILEATIPSEFLSIEKSRNGPDNCAEALVKKTKRGQV